jgi:hypothetical protein
MGFINHRIIFTTVVYQGLQDSFGTTYDWRNELIPFLAINYDFSHFYMER